MGDEVRDTIERFHEAFSRRDLGALGNLITDDCVLDATIPAPDGTRKGTDPLHGGRGRRLAL